MEVVFGKGGKYDGRVMPQILIDDEKHRIRSVGAEKATADAQQKHPLPAGAGNGGCRSADPHSREEVLLSVGTFLNTC